MLQIRKRIFVSDENGKTATQVASNRWLLVFLMPLDVM